MRNGRTGWLYGVAWTYHEGMTDNDYGYVGLCPTDITVTTRPLPVTTVDTAALDFTSNGEIIPEPAA